MTERIYLSSPDITQEEEDAVVRAIRSRWVAPLGPEVDAFEAELAMAAGRAHAVALSSGTAALHLGLLQLDAGPGTVVLTSSMTFAATANAITYTGAIPVFVDSDETGNVDAGLLAEALRDQRRHGAKIAAIVPVDLIGKVADHQAIGAIAAEYGVPVLVDAAESLGAQRDGRPAGACGVASVVSFNGNKIMTTSGGGALLCDDEAMAARTRYLATQARQPVVHYEHVDIGYNYRMSNILAALGRAQLSRLPQMLERRREWRCRYASFFAGVVGVEIFGGADGRDRAQGEDRDNFWLTSIVVDPEVAGWTASDLQAWLAEVNIEARPLWKPMHLQPVFAGRPAYVNGSSERYFRTGLSLPSGSALSSQDFQRVLDRIQQFLERATS